VRSTSPMAASLTSSTRVATTGSQCVARVAQVTPCALCGAHGRSGRKWRQSVLSGSIGGVPARPQPAAAAARSGAGGSSARPTVRRKAATLHAQKARRQAMRASQANQKAGERRAASAPARLSW